MNTESMYTALGITPAVHRFGEEILAGLRARFDEIDRVAEYNQCKVIGAMQKNRVDATHFAATTGYGYNDAGRDNLERVYADCFHMSVTVRDIKTDRPTAEELCAWHARSGLPLKRFFNTSGLQYKALGLKDKLPTMTEDEQLALLATDGMLVKRPLLVADDFVLVGFREKEWEERL